MAQKPSIPKGTRDFGQIEMAERNYIFDTIRSVFRKFGYSQIETPAMENLSTLMGKYGEEGDKLLFRILNSGDAFAGVDMTRPLTSQVCEKGLRYDLTVPFARYVVQHQSEISFPFKRFQIQPVWRADRPQKGRYREFYQCDVDVIGSKSQLLELELVQIADEVFRRLDINVLIKINNRKVLSGLAEICGAPDKVVDITVAIDKLDKIGLEAVEAEMIEKGLTPEAVKLLEPVLTLSGSNEQKIASMRSLMAESQIGQKGLDELEELFGYIKAAGIETACEIDLSLARGLNYYTGAIFEIKALDWQIGSISGGNLLVIVVIILWLSAVASAFIDNIPFAATMGPVIRSISAAQGVDLSVLAWALSLGTDLGGNGTPIGASANVVGTSVSAKQGHPIRWGTYCKYCAPATVLAVLASMLCLLLRFF